MISEEDRKKKKLKVHNIGYFIQQLKQTGKSLFKKERAGEMYLEIETHIFNENRCVFVVDERDDSQSNYIAMFITDSGGFIAIPCFVDEVTINIFTIKDVAKDDHPNWYISKYQEIGKLRELYSLKISFDGSLPKDLNSLLSTK